KRRKLLDQSWAGLFQKELLCELPIGKVTSFFTDGFGRPTKEMYTVLGALLLQQTHDLTDEETVNQVAFNIQWHYALNITEESDSAKYICPKTLWNMRSIVVDNGLDAILFDHITDKLAKVFKVNTDKQRIDSVHIHSNMRRLGRIGIFTSSINKFLVNLKRSHKELFDTIDKGIIDRYLPKESLQCFSMVRPSESAKTLASVSADLFHLVAQFKDNPEVRSMHSYKLLERVLKEQCVVKDDGTAVELKRPQEIPSDSLQNPSDPDATYSGHKGQGYQVQIMETYHPDKEGKKESLNLITHVEVEPAHESDANALLPAIESSKKRSLAPDKLLADTLYGGDENCQEAKELGVEVISPAKSTKEKDGITLSDFNVNERGDIVSCPQGHVPVKRKTKKTRHTVAFDSQKCCTCPFQEICPVKQGTKYHYLRYTNKAMRLAQRRAYEKTDEFKDHYRWRAGVEATMSEYDRRTGVKHLRVRGFKAVRFCATLKAVGLNIFRATAVQRALNKAKTAHGRLLPALIYAMYIVKERFLKGWGQSTKIFTLFYCYYRHPLIMVE
ncbi:MAG: transposase, partial [Deltaproteobacteria bacterium]|nr:transposase [Deltaproteobacteria bacterium]